MQRIGRGSVYLVKNNETPNHVLNRLVRCEPSAPHTPVVVGMDINQVMLNWQEEAKTMEWLVATRKDLILCLQRNGLPLGYIRGAWGAK